MSSHLEELEERLVLDEKKQQNGYNHKREKGGIKELGLIRDLGFVKLIKM